MDLKDKSLIGLTLLALAGWGAFSIQVRNPTTQDRVVERVVEKEVLVEVIKEVVVEVVKEVQVDKWKTRVETRPDGTRIVEESGEKRREERREKSASKESSKEVIQEQIREKTVITPSHTLSLYSLALGIGNKISFAESVPTPIYSMEFGARLGTTPLWLTLEGNTDKEILLGLRAEF